MVRAAATIDQSAEQEDNLRTLISFLDRLGESDVLDQLRPEVERSFRVGHLYAEALARRGSLTALEGYVRADAHPWEYATRVGGAIPVLIARAAADAAGRRDTTRLFEAWAAAATVGPDADQTKYRAWTHVRSELGQAWAFIGDEGRARAIARELEAQLEAKGADRITCAAKLAPLLAVLGDPRDLIAVANAAWDELFDEDIDGYGRVHHEMITDAAHRTRHLAVQRTSPRETWVWDEGPSFAQPYVPPFSSRWSGGGAKARIDQALHHGRLEEAITVLDGTTDERVLTAFAVALPESKLSPERRQLARIAMRSALGRLERPTLKDGSWAVPPVCAALARLGFLDEALGLTSLAEGASLTLASEARLNVCEVWLGTRGVLAGGREALERIVAELSPRGDHDVFAMPVSYAQLLLSLSSPGGEGRGEE
ncbi:MAG: hypothetical protein U0228_34075 [Myxococcaceae bacterium]